MAVGIKKRYSLLSIPWCLVCRNEVYKPLAPDRSGSRRSAAMKPLRYGPVLECLDPHKSRISFCTAKLASLREFCWNTGKSGEHALFIIDQTNAFDGSEPGMERIDNEQKKLARSLLDSISIFHMKIARSTANYKHASTDMLRQTGEGRIGLYHGLNDAEMEVWRGLNETVLAEKFELSGQFGDEEKP
ncbi:hypothetical protein FN846DRAFT_911473 [Sphaerosporella brunnea]|uniref:Uncharacterized protein n=1 Tax=Sphaerosporella brunnea TaxID=1250544 RepID=A0A5J5ELR3_9PEZI|nr:hypothetical protein FN846DRAFT_911473 [Sphaerosporella brunnea]